MPQESPPPREPAPPSLVMFCPCRRPTERPRPKKPGDAGEEPPKRQREKLANCFPYVRLRLAKRRCSSRPVHFYLAIRCAT
ncbi:hypothetical protein JG687_00008370 [Phytophthora cactorum]|uniref:Uncharacterized protein n=1 Tax=Phytophthora cactorum TaxID=29920 RepID=A0A8T1UCX8_9STRA|nr:hypothetical protein JG687_00008370 [Phytophthora cactorum]